MRSRTDRAPTDSCSSTQPSEPSGRLATLAAPNYLPYARHTPRRPPESAFQSPVGRHCPGVRIACSSGIGRQGLRRAASVSRSAPLYGACEPGDGARGRAVAQAAALGRAVEANADRACLVCSRSELEDSRLRLLLAMKGVEPLEGDPGAFEAWYERGVRSAGLTWNHANEFAGGIHSPTEGSLHGVGRRCAASASEAPDAPDPPKRRFSCSSEGGVARQALKMLACNGNSSARAARLRSRAAAAGGCLSRQANRPLSAPAPDRLRPTVSY